MSSHCAGDDPWACLKLKILLGRTLRVPHLEVGVSHDRIKQACNMGLVTVYNCIYTHVDIQYTWTFVPIFHTYVLMHIKINMQGYIIHYMYIECIKKPHVFFQGQGLFPMIFRTGFLAFAAFKKRGPYRRSVPRRCSLSPSVWGKLVGANSQGPKKERLHGLQSNTTNFSGTYPPPNLTASSHLKSWA